MCDEKFDLYEVDHSIFVKPVSDEALKSLVENQENVNTKNNTKWAINVFNKWRESIIIWTFQNHQNTSKCLLFFCIHNRFVL